MNQARKREETGQPVFRWLKEIYLSIFVLFFQISRWRGEMKIGTASMGVSSILCILVVTIWVRVEIAMHLRSFLSPWAIIGLIPLFVANDDFLVRRRAGPNFERQFQMFKRSKRLRLYTLAILIVVGSVVAVFLSLAEYHRTLSGA